MPNLKLNVEFGNPEFARNGYINIVLHPNLKHKPHEGINITVGDFKNLDPVIENDSVEEFIFNPALNVLSPVEMTKVLAHWKSKLQPDGILKTSFADVRRVGRGANSGQLTLEQVHNLLLGNQNDFKSVLDLQTVRLAFSSVGLVIDSIAPTDFITTIEAKKNA